MKGQGFVVPLTPTPKEHYRMLAQDFELKLTLKPEAVLKLGELPFPLDGDLIGLGSADGEDQEYRVPFKGAYGCEEEAELLHWFLKLVGPDDGEAADNEVKQSNSESSQKSQQELSTKESRGSLVFPDSFTKYQRAHWHQVADKWGLHSESEGFGPDRHLKITWEPEKPQAAPSTGSKSSRSRSDASSWQRQKAKRIWDWCQTEGGSYLNYSQGEILQILTTNVMPPDLARLEAKRDMAKRVIDRLQRKDSEGALILLKKDRSLVWIQDEECGGYPLHVAAWQGLGSVVAWIIEQPTALEQRDKQRKTPLQVARRRQHKHIMDLLLEAGAKDAGLSAGEQLDSSIFSSRELEGKQRYAEEAKCASNLPPATEGEKREKETEKRVEPEKSTEEVPERVADKSTKRAAASSSDSASEKNFARQGSFKRPVTLSARVASERDLAEEWNSPVALAPKVESGTEADVFVTSPTSPLSSRRVDVAATENVVDRAPKLLRERAGERDYHPQKKRDDLTPEPRLQTRFPKPEGAEDLRDEGSSVKDPAAVAEAASWKPEGLQNKRIEYMTQKVPQTEEGLKPRSPPPSMAAKKPCQKGESSAYSNSRCWYPAEEKCAAQATASLGAAAQEDLMGGGGKLFFNSASSSSASELAEVTQQAPAQVSKKGYDAKPAQPTAAGMSVKVTTKKKNVEFLEGLLEAASPRPLNKAQSAGASSDSESAKGTATLREMAASMGTVSKSSEAATEQPASPQPQELEAAAVGSVQPLRMPATGVRSWRGWKPDLGSFAARHPMEAIFLVPDGTEIDVTKALEEQRSLRCSYKGQRMTVSLGSTAFQPETLPVGSEQAATTQQPATSKQLHSAAQQNSNAGEGPDEHVARAMLSTTAALQATNDSLKEVIQLARAALRSGLPAVAHYSAGSHTAAVGRQVPPSMSGGQE